MLCVNAEQGAVTFTRSDRAREELGLCIAQTNVWKELVEHSEWLHLSNEKNWKQLESEDDIYRKRENLITSWGDGKVLDIIKMAMIFKWM